MVTDPNFNNNLWTGGIHSNGSIEVMSVAKSLDNGATWTRYEIGQAKGITRSLAVDPSNSNIVFAGGIEDSLAILYATTDGGGSWFFSGIGITGDTVNAIAFDPFNDNIIYCGTADGIFKSTDWGNTWLNAGCSDVNTILINQNSSDTVYVGTDDGVYMSSDQGQSWTEMNTGLADTYVYCLGIHPNNYIFAATNMGGMYRWDLGSNVSEKKYTSVNKLYSGATIFAGSLQFPRYQDYRIFDISGREVDVRHLRPGVYFIEINSAFVQKIVKVR